MTEHVELKVLRNDEATDDGGTLHCTEDLSEEAPKLISTPPNEEEPYTLTAYGDISLSDIDYVPGPPSEISPSQVKKKESWRRFPRNDSENMVRCPAFLSQFGYSTCISNSRGVFRVSQAECDLRRSPKDGPRKWRRLTSW
jgi:hypothetical protein